MSDVFKPGDLVVRKVSRQASVIDNVAIFLGFPTGTGKQKRAYFLDTRGVHCFFVENYIHARFVVDGQEHRDELDA